MHNLKKKFKYKHLLKHVKQKIKYNLFDLFKSKAFFNFKKLV